MSTTLNIHHGGDPTVIISIPGDGIYFAKGPTVPSNGTSGFAKGCLFIDTLASEGSILLCNEGSNTSCNFDVVPVA